MTMILYLIVISVAFSFRTSDDVVNKRNLNSGGPSFGSSSSNPHDEYLKSEDFLKFKKQVKSGKIFTIGDSLNLPFKDQKDAERLIEDDDISRTFLFKTNDNYGFADFFGNDELNVILNVFTNVDPIKLEKNGFYLGIGIGNFMGGSDFALAYYNGNNTWNASDYYSNITNPRALKKDSEFGHNDTYDNVEFFTRTWFINLDSNNFKYRSLIRVYLKKKIGVYVLDKYDSSLLSSNWKRNNVPIMGSFGFLLYNDFPFYHIARNKKFKTYINRNSNQEVLEYSKQYNQSGIEFSNFTMKIVPDNRTMLKLEELILKNENIEDKPTIDELIKIQKQENLNILIDYYSNAKYTELPFKSFLELIDFEKLDGFQAYTLSDGETTPDEFVMTTFYSKTEEPNAMFGKTYILTNKDMDLLISRGFYCGILLGRRVMADGDFVMLHFEGLEKQFRDFQNYSRFKGFDGYVDPKYPRLLQKDSYFALRDYLNLTDEQFNYELALNSNILPNATAYDNVELLNGENVSPVIFKLKDTDILFGKFKTMIKFEWKKSYQNIDKYDWKTINQWEKNLGFTGTAFNVNNEEGEFSYHGDLKSSTSNIVDGSDLRTNTLEIYNIEYLRSEYHMLSIFLTFLYIIYL